MEWPSIEGWRYAVDQDLFFLFRIMEEAFTSPYLDWSL